MHLATEQKMVLRQKNDGNLVYPFQRAWRLLEGDFIISKTENILITVQEASQIVLENKQDFGTEQVPLIHSINRVLKEDLHAERDFPPFHRVSMDGIAIQNESFQLHEAVKKG